MMYVALPTTSGVRYILAGFCDYLDSNHRVSMESFLSEYDPQHDGYAAAEGFQTGDIIRGIKSCLPTESDDMFAVKEFMMSTDDLSDDDWKRYATSCEVAAPKSKTVFLVERNPNAI